MKGSKENTKEGQRKGQGKGQGKRLGKGQWKGQGKEQGKGQGKGPKTGIIIMASDFKQCLPVIPNGSRADTRIICPRDSRGQIIRSTLQRTTFWERVLLFSLTQSMRLDADTPETWHRQMDELGNGRTNPVFLRDFDRPQTEFLEKIDLILDQFIK